MKYITIFYVRIYIYLESGYAVPFFFFRFRSPYSSSTSGHTISRYRAARARVCIYNGYTPNRYIERGVAYSFRSNKSLSLMRWCLRRQSDRDEKKHAQSHSTATGVQCACVRDITISGYKHNVQSMTLYIHTHTHATAINTFQRLGIYNNAVQSKTRPRGTRKKNRKIIEIKKNKIKPSEKTRLISRGDCSDVTRLGIQPADIVQRTNVYIYILSDFYGANVFFFFFRSRGVYYVSFVFSCNARQRARRVSSYTEIRRKSTVARTPRKYTKRRFRRLMEGPYMSACRPANTVLYRRR